MKGEVTFGIDLGSDCIKTGFAFEHETDTFCTGKLAFSYFDDTFPACGYCTPEDDEWVFGEDIFSENKDFERIVRIKDLLKYYDGTEQCDYYVKPFSYPKFRPHFIEDTDSVYDQTKTFQSKYSPKEVAEKFFNAYFITYFMPAVRKLAATYQGLLWDSLFPTIVVIPDNARDEYALELLRLVALGNFVSIKTKGYRSRRVSETVALFATHEKKLMLEERALVADLGETGLTLSIVKGHNLEEYLNVSAIGGTNYDQDVFEHVKTVLKQKHGEDSENYGTYYQLFNLELRIKNAKATLSSAGAGKTRIEVEGATTELVPLTEQMFLKAVQRTTARVADAIYSAAAKARVHKIILSGGAAQTCGLVAELKRRDSRGEYQVVVHGEVVPQKAKDMFDVYDRGTEFAPAIGAALAATRRFNHISRAPRSYGIEAFDVHDQKPWLSLIIKKNTELPVSVKQTYATMRYGRNIQTTLYATDQTQDICLKDNEHISELINRGTISIKDKGCEAWFPFDVRKDYPVDIEIRIDWDGVGEVHAYDGVTGQEIEWRGNKFSTVQEEGGRAR